MRVGVFCIFALCGLGCGSQAASVHGARAMGPLNPDYVRQVELQTFADDTATHVQDLGSRVSQLERDLKSMRKKSRESKGPDPQLTEIVQLLTDRLEMIHERVVALEAAEGSE